MTATDKQNKVVIVGAGPAGLGCAYELLSHNENQVTILDKNEKVGGLARSTDFHGHFYDVGPHRFYTKNREVLSLWRKVLGKDFIEVDRLTRSLYKNKLFQYPVKFSDALIKLGVKDSTESLISFIQAKLFLRTSKPETFEDWVTKNFGRKLYEIIFKTYTEKIWGIRCNKISAEWAAQRIKNIDLIGVIKNAFSDRKKNGNKSWIDKFLYPKQGAGQMYEVMAQTLEKRGQKVLLNSNVSSIRHRNNRITAVSFDRKGAKLTKPINYLFSSMPLTHFIFSLNPKPPEKILQAARKLYYRDHITVNLLVDKPDLFPDNWIYIYSPELKMARVTNYNNFVERKTKLTLNDSAITVEYFVFKKDKLWKLSDKKLVGLAVKEIKKTGLIKNQNVVDSFVVRETESYPTYYLGHERYFNTLKDYVSRFSNLQLIGRGGMYKYNNMDHSIYSGMLAARNYIAGKRIYNVWQINEEAEYLEK